MNLPNPFSSGLFDNDVTFRDDFQSTPRRTPSTTRIKPRRQGNQKSTQNNLSDNNADQSPHNYMHTQSQR